MKQNMCHRLFVIFTSITLLAMLSGCGVHRVRAENYVPGTSQRPEIFYNCMREGQQFQASSAYSGSSGAMQAGVEANPETVHACMNARGYQLREMTGFEMGLSFLTFPLALFMALMGAPPTDFY